MTKMTAPGRRFLHVPRTGGTAIMRQWQLAAPEYQSHDLLAAPNANVFSYVVVRHPLPRILSLYLHVAPDPNVKSFRRWVTSGLDMSQLRPDMPSHLSLPAHAWAQHANYVVPYEAAAPELDALASLFDRPPLTWNVSGSSVQHHQQVLSWYGDSARLALYDAHYDDFLHYDYSTRADAPWLPITCTPSPSTPPPSRPATTPST